MQKKEKTIPVTVRISESLFNDISEMAEVFGVTRNRLLAVLLESGKVIAESIQEGTENDG